MTFDQLQKNWQSQPTGPKLTIDSDMLQKQVRRNKRSFESAIFWRDVREVGVGIVMFILFVYWGLKYEFWSLHVIALSIAFVVVFMVVDRILNYRRQPQCNDTLLGCIKSSLRQIKHQIWLLKNVLWWYLLPPSIGIGVFIICCAFSVIKAVGVANSARHLVFMLVYLVFLFLLYWGIYWLNQRAVRKELIPRKQELEQLMASLKNSITLPSDKLT